MNGAGGQWKSEFGLYGTSRSGADFEGQSGERKALELATDQLLKSLDLPPKFGDYLKDLEQQRQIHILKRSLWEPSGE